MIGNNGPAIPAELLPVNFEPLFTTGKSSGTGLGLAIAKMVVTTHRGGIACKSDHDVGVEFSIVLKRQPSK